MCDISVELRMFVELFRCGLGSLDICSTKTTSESSELIDVFDAISTLKNEIQKNFWIDLLNSKNERERERERERECVGSLLRVMIVHFHEAGFPLMFPRRCSASMKVGKKVQFELMRCKQTSKMESLSLRNT